MENWNDYLEQYKIKKEKARVRKLNKIKSRRKYASRLIHLSKKELEDYNFYNSDLWLKYRYKAFVDQGNVCSDCRCSEKVVDVYSLFLELRLTDWSKFIDSLKVLCQECSEKRGIVPNHYIHEKNSPLIRTSSYHSGFYGSPEWIHLRNQAFLEQGSKCSCCHTENGELHADHIKPISKFPELKLSLDNIQILCKKCNLGKSNLDKTNWKKKI